MVPALIQLVLAIAVVAVGQAGAGAIGALAALTMVGLTAAAVRLTFARFGHLMFRAGRMAEARRYYRVLAVAAWRRTRRDAARVSIAATYVGAGDYARGRALLDAIAPDRLEPATRAGWLNNRAYAALRAGARGDEARAALADVRAALALYAEVPAFLHTEALALYACGEPDRAIAAWEALWQQVERSPRLDAERRDDLAAAWEARGETAYAEDYRRWAKATVPSAPWRGEVDG